MQKNARIFIVGHREAIENSLVSGLRCRGFKHVYSNHFNDIDVLDYSKTDKFFKSVRPEYVFLGSIRSGGIGVNLKMPAEFIFENCQAQNNVIHVAFTHKAKKLLYFTGSCAYPALARQPIKEESLLTGPLEESSAPYSVAKIAGTKMCQAYRAQYGFNAIVAVPATLYGPGSDDDLATAHVMGSLIAKFTQAVKNNVPRVEVWGTGKPRREFLYVDDFVDACMMLIDKYEDTEMINCGTGEDIAIKDLAKLIAQSAGFKGNITFDVSKPDGTMRKLMDNERISKLGWVPKVGLAEGIEKTIGWYRNLALALLFLGLMPVLAFAQNTTTLRCEGRLVSQGDSMHRVQDICGPPAYIDVAQQEIRVKIFRRIHSEKEEKNESLGHDEQLDKRYSQDKNYVFDGEHQEMVDIQEWTYNFGPSRFIQVLKFENDRLRSIIGGGYGYDKDVSNTPHVEIGDSKAIVMMKYGKPKDIYKHESSESWDTYESAGKILNVKTVKEIVDEQEWLYDFGLDRFQERLTFKQNRLEKIEKMKDRGTKK